MLITIIRNISTETLSYWINNTPKRETLTQQEIAHIEAELAYRNNINN